MQFERIRVETRDEYRGAQEPVGFHWRGQHFGVAVVLDRWYEGYLDAGRMPLRYFKVESSEGRQFILRYHELFSAWSILVPSQSTED